MRPGVTLFQHQQTIIANAEERIRRGLPFYAIFAEQGTSKTLTMLVLALRLYKSGAIRHALVVCPTSVRGSWSPKSTAGFTPTYLPSPKRWPT